MAMKRGRKRVTLVMAVMMALIATDALNATRARLHRLQSFQSAMRWSCWLLLGHKPQSAALTLINAEGYTAMRQRHHIGRIAAARESYVILRDESLSAPSQLKQTAH
ncbi:unnamed protein product [Merluccius merluccius]